MLKNFLCLLNVRNSIGNGVKCKNFHLSATCQVISKWKEYNEKVYPPQSPDEVPRNAFVCHYKENIKYSPSKLWYVACLVRGMAVDEALKQLDFVQKKGAAAVKETILEAQKLAVNDHNVEFASNLWISESFVGKGRVIRGLRRTKRGMNQVKYKYCHYFVTLEEGQPPKDYYYFTREKSGNELLDEWLIKMRQRRILSTL